MKKIKIFLASSNELENERRQFEIEIYRKTKMWFDKKIFLHLDVWEDLSARLVHGGSQGEYNALIEEADVFILLAYSKVGMYTAEEFDSAFGQFQSTQRPFIYTYFKDIEADKEDSLDAFKQKLSYLKHYYSSYSDFNDLWNQFNKELDRLMEGEFKAHAGDFDSLRLAEKNIVEADITNTKRIMIGDKVASPTEQYNRKNIFKGNVDGADDFTLGDGH